MVTRVLNREEIAQLSMVELYAFFEIPYPVADSDIVPWDDSDDYEDTFSMRANPHVVGVP